MYYTLTTSKLYYTLYYRSPAIRVDPSILLCSRIVLVPDNTLDVVRIPYEEGELDA